MEIKLRELKEYAGKIGKDVDDTNERLNQFKDLIQEEINEKIQSIMKKIAQRGTGQKSSGGPDHLASMEGIENIKKMMLMKADKAEVERLNHIKCNKVDSENILDIQSIMCKQFQHILVLFIEIVNCQAVKDNMPKQSIETKISNLVN